MAARHSSRVWERGRVQGGYTFTTLNPVVDIMHIAGNRSLVGGGSNADGVAYEDTVVEKQCEQELMESVTYTDMLTHNH